MFDSEFINDMYRTVIIDTPPTIVSIFVNAKKYVDTIAILE